MVRKPRVYKRSGDKYFSFYFYNDDGQRVFRKTEDAARSRAEAYAEEYVRDYFKKPGEVTITLKDFAKDFFVWGKCSWIERQHA